MKVFMGSVLRIFLFFFKQKTAYEILACGVQTCALPISDALFDLTDALLTAEAVPSPVHLSLAPAHRRGWGSVYAALREGRIDVDAPRGVLPRHLLAGGQIGRASCRERV